MAFSICSIRLSVYEVPGRRPSKQAVLTQNYRIYAGNELVRLPLSSIRFYASRTPAAHVERQSRMVYLRNISGKSLHPKGRQPLAGDQPHHVWNDFRRFWSTSRPFSSPREDNESYRKRMKTVGFVPPGASKIVL